MIFDDQWQPGQIRHALHLVRANVAARQAGPVARPSGRPKRTPARNPGQVDRLVTHRYATAEGVASRSGHDFRVPPQEL
jgi:hypothetical protein